MYRDPHHLVHMTSLVVSIYCQSIPGQESLHSGLTYLVLFTWLRGLRLKWGKGTVHMKRENVRITDIDHLMLSSFRCDFDDTAQYRVSAMNSNGELSAFASVVVKSRFH